MPSPQVARKAAATRQKIADRCVDLINNHGMSPEDAVKQARRELHQKALSPAKLAEHAADMAKLAQTGRRRRIRFTGTTPKQPAQPSQSPNPGSRGGAAASSSQHGSSQNPATSSIRGKLAGAGLSAAVAPSTASTPKAKASVQGLVPKDWEVDGKFLKVMLPGSKQDILLPIEKAPGPYTPTEEIHDILGQSKMLYKVALAIAEDTNVLVKGPTGVAKTVVFRWFAKKLNWNIVTAQIHGGTAPEDLVGEFLPVEQQGKSQNNVAQLIKFIYAVVSKGVIASQEHPTMVVLEEVNRIGNQQAFAKIYSLLDDTKQIEIPNKEDAKGLSEVLRPGKLIFGANMNPPDPGYIGNQQLDYAFGRRFPIWVDVAYPPEDVEAEALRRRVKGLSLTDAKKMVAMATLVRKDEEIAYPLSFPDMVSWATMLPYLGWDEAAESAVVAKADPDDWEGLRGLILLAPNRSSIQP